MPALRLGHWVVTEPTFRQRTQHNKVSSRLCLYPAWSQEESGGPLCESPALGVLNSHLIVTQRPWWAKIQGDGDGHRLGRAFTMCEGEEGRGLGTRA